MRTIKSRKSTQSKYKNKKVVTAEGVFDSKKEYKRWLELKEMQDRGDITALTRQFSFELIPAQKLPTPVVNKAGKRKLSERAVTYKADFVYRDSKGQFTVEDTKGLKTPEYILKRKLLLYTHGLQIKET